MAYDDNILNQLNEICMIFLVLLSMRLANKISNPLNLAYGL